MRTHQKIAIMGGTFDPIHYGHLTVAEAAHHKLGAEVVFVPSGKPPHKDNLLVSGREHRYLMCALAVSDNPAFSVSRIEIDRDGASYTVDTIRAMRARYPDDTEFYFITGADALNEIFTWKDPETLLGLCGFVSVARPGYGKFDGRLAENLIFLDAPALDISSSDIRDRVRKGLPITYLLPKPVEDYIRKNALYPASDTLAADINAYLKLELTDKRYIHTVGVMEAAVKLASRYGEDADKARITGLLHDCAKNFPDERMAEYVARYRIPLDDITKNQINLMHSFVGAEIAGQRFGVADIDMLDAIRYHTTGRVGMSRLEKILYVADCIEGSREYYGGLEKIREAAFVDLDAAMTAGLIAAIDYTVAKGRPVHPLSERALNYIRNGEGQ